MSPTLKNKLGKTRFITKSSELEVIWESDTFSEVTNHDWDQIDWKQVNTNVTKIKQNIFVAT